MNVQYIIQDNVPLLARGTDEATPPYTKLEVGQSLFVPITARKVTSVRNGVLQIGKRLQRKFAVRACEGGCRVWRTA